MTDMGAYINMSRRAAIAAGIGDEPPWDLVEVFGFDWQEGDYVRLRNGRQLAFASWEAKYAWRDDLVAGGARRERALRRARL